MFTQGRRFGENLGEDGINIHIRSHFRIPELIYGFVNFVLAFLAFNSAMHAPSACPMRCCFRPISNIPMT